MNTDTHKDRHRDTAADTDTDTDTQNQWHSAFIFVMRLHAPAKEAWQATILARKANKSQKSQMKVTYSHCCFPF